MPNQVCLLCLQVIDDTGGKSPQKLGIKTLCKLMTACHHSSKSGHDLPPEFEEDDMCQFCANCYPLLIKMEEIRTQISLLEEEIGSKVRQIKATILHTSHAQNNGQEKTIQIRDMILRRTGENENTEKECETNFVGGEVNVKDEENEIDSLDDDRLFNADINSYCEANMEKTEVQDFIKDEENVETPFCIIPWPQTNLAVNDNPKCTTKRKIQNSSPPPETITKKNKPQLEPSTLTPRFSPRRKKQTPGVKSRVSCSQKLHPIKTPKTISNSDDDTKSTPLTDKDEAPSIETSDAIRPQPHKCTKCDKSFISKYTLTLHITRSHGVRCVVPLCTATFPSEYARSDHVQTAHQGLPSYQCRLCTATFRLQSYLAAHMVMRHENSEKKLSCVKCGKKFCLEENLARHLSLHDVEASKPLVCDVCDDRFENEDRLELHLATHSKPFKCTQCPHRCTSRVYLERHLMTHRQGKIHKCPQCDHTVSDQYTLKDHVARAHPVGPATDICYICGKGFYLPADLKTHLAWHDGKFGRKCDTCGETFPSSSRLETHLIKVHGKDPFVCKECGATYTTHGGFSYHKKVHAGEKRHKCEICGAGFFSPFNLKVHIRQVHTGERPFPCDQCGKGFALKSALTTHFKTAHSVVSGKKNKLPRLKKVT